MIKKIISVVLSFLMVTVGLLVSAEPAAVNQEDITVQLNVFSIDVTVQAASDYGSVTAQIRSTDTGDTRIYGVDEAICAQGKDGTFSYIFHFKMPAAAITGTYAVKLGNSVAPVLKEFSFVNVQDKINFYNTLDSAPVHAAEGETTICGLLYDENCKTTYDLTVYRALSEDV